VTDYDLCDGPIMAIAARTACALVAANCHTVCSRRRPDRIKAHVFGLAKAATGRTNADRKRCCRHDRNIRRGIGLSRSTEAGRLLAREGGFAAAVVADV
jgi:hypothetical protein